MTFAVMTPLDQLPIVSEAKHFISSFARVQILSSIRLMYTQVCILHTVEITEVQGWNAQSSGQSAVIPSVGTVWTLIFVVLNFCSFHGLTTIHESLVPRKFRPALTGQRMMSVLMNSDILLLQKGYRGSVVNGVAQRRIASVSRHTRFSSAHDRLLRQISGQQLQKDRLYCFLRDYS